MLISKVRKSGNSLVLVLPSEVIKERKIKIVETVEYDNI